MGAGDSGSGLAQVWPFFSDAANLEQLTPPFVRFSILTPRPVRMRLDARIEYRLRVRGIPLRWRTRIARWEPPSCFADEQERGPYRRWLHTHPFEPMAGGTSIGDRVESALHGGPFAPLLSRLFVERDLLRIFRYRLDRIALQLGGDAATGRVWLTAVEQRRPSASASCVRAISEDGIRWSVSAASSRTACRCSTSAAAGAR